MRRPGNYAKGVYLTKQKTKDLMLSSFSRGKFAPTVLRTPLWIPQIILPLGFSVLAFFLVEQLMLTFRKSEEH